MNSVSDWKDVIFAITSLTSCGLYIYKMTARMTDETADSNILLDILIVGSLILFTIYSVKQAYAPLLYH